MIFFSFSFFFFVAKGRYDSYPMLCTSFCNNLLITHSATTVLLVGLPEKYTGFDDVAKQLYPNVYIFPFLPQVAFARKFMVNVHRVFPTRS